MTYVRANSAADACEALAAHSDPFVLAGGTDLLVQMKSRRIRPDCIVDIKHLPGIGEIAADAGGARVGASVPGIALGDHAGFSRLWPGVAEAAQLIGSTQIQGRATMVGNLCNASPAADTIPALIAADAVAVVESPSGARRVPVAEIPTGPGKTQLAAGEFVSALEFPGRGAGQADAYIRFIPRTEMDIAVASAGANLTLDGDGTITAARVALGAVAPVPFLLKGAGDLLIGTRADEGTLEKLSALAAEAARPIADKRGTVAFRRRVAGVLAARAVKLAYTRAGERQ